MTREEARTEDLLEAARAGDLEAWNRLDGRYRGLLALFMRGRIPAAARRRFDTEDMLQSALFSAFTRIDSFDYRGAGSFERWVRKLVLNRMHGRLREHFAAKRDLRMEEDLDGAEAALPRPPSAESPSQAFTRAETIALLLRAMAELPEIERELIQRVVFDRQRVEEISRELGLSERQVRRHRQRVLESLRRRLAELAREDARATEPAREGGPRGGA